MSCNCIYGTNTLNIERLKRGTLLPPEVVDEKHFGEDGRPIPILQQTLQTLSYSVFKGMFYILSLLINTPTFWISLLVTITWLVKTPLAVLPGRVEVFHKSSSAICIAHKFRNKTSQLSVKLPNLATQAEVALFRLASPQ